MYADVCKYCKLNGQHFYQTKLTYADVCRYFKLIGQHFHETKHLDKAERFYIKARCPQVLTLHALLVQKYKILIRRSAFTSRRAASLYLLY